MTDKVSSEDFIKAFGNGVKDNREITQISDEASSETDILIPLSEVENDINMREAYETGFREGYAQCITDIEERKENNRLFQKGGAE